MRRNTAGFALVVTMLIGLVVLIVVVTTASISTLGTRRNVSDERQTFRAQLVAESGINTFPARMRASDLRVGTPLDEVDWDTWLMCPDPTQPGALGHTAFCFSGLGANTQVDLAVENVRPAAGRITVSATGTLANGSRKVVVDDFSVSFEPAFHVPVGAALTSLPYVKVGGNASIVGEDGTTAGSGTIAGVTTLAASSSYASNESSVAVTVQDSTYLPTGGYVQIADASATTRTYKIQAKDGDTLTLGILDPPSVGVTVTIGAGEPVNLVPFAAKGPATPPEGSGTVSTVQVSDTSGFTGGMTVFVHGWTGTVQAVGSATGDPNGVSVLWSAHDAAVTGTIGEGDAFSRSVYDVASGSSIDVNGNADACGFEGGGTGAYDDSRCADGAAPGNPLPGMTADDLFQATFGMTLDAFNAAFPAVSTFDGTASASQVINVDGSLNLSGSTEICGGPAILVVQGDLTLNGSCDPTADNPEGGFHGLIYVTGQFRQQGNSDLYGAVVVDGSYSTVGPDTTTVTGTNDPKADGSKIQYDMAALLQAGSALSLRDFTAVAGTWRQR